MFPPGGMNTGLPLDPGANGYVSAGGTIPFPSPDPKFRPVGYWEGEPAGISWAASAAGVAGQTASYTGRWASPLFNLRPDTDTASSRQNRAFPINRVAGTQLFINVSGLRNSYDRIELRARVVGHSVDPIKAGACSAYQNVSADLATGLDVAVLNFLPFSGYPLKYWGIELSFTVIPTTGESPPNITVQAGVY